SATGSFSGFSGLISGDVVSLDGSALFAFADKNVGSGKTVTISGLSLTGADAGNYTIASATSATAAITPKTLTVSAAADDKVYDGTTSATGSFGGFSGLISGDVVSLDGSALFAFADKNAGSGKTVSVSNIGLSGTDAGNYVIASTASSTAAITPKTLTVSATADDKVYDGTTSATGSFSGFSGLISGDVVSLDGSALFAFADKNAGSGKTVSVSNIGLSGTDAGNYVIASTASSTAAITPKTLTVSATADDKVYDGTTSATGSFGAFSGLISGDMVSLDGSALFAFADMNAGSGKTVNVSNIGLSGTDAGNYAIASSLTTTASITPKTLTVNALAASMIYGDAMPGLSFTVTGYAGSDNMSLMTGALSTSGGSGSNAGTYAISQGSLSAGGNYQIAFTGADLVINRRAVTVTANNLTRPEDVANPLLTYALTSGSLVAGDSFTGALATSAGLSSPIGTYLISQGSLALNSNYDLTFVPGTLTISGEIVMPQIFTPQAYESQPPLATPEGVPSQSCQVGGGGGGVYPCNRTFGPWLSAQAE
ncbi:YDG domain-containing protein, partial [Roseibium suaedae]